MWGEHKGRQGGVSVKGVRRAKRKGRQCGVSVKGVSAT